MVNIGNASGASEKNGQSGRTKPVSPLNLGAKKRTQVADALSRWAHCWLPIEDRNSKFVAAARRPAFAIFEFPVSSFERNQSQFANLLTKDGVPAKFNYPVS